MTELENRVQKVLNESFNKCGEYDGKRGGLVCEYCVVHDEIRDRLVKSAVLLDIFNEIEAAEKVDVNTGKYYLDFLSPVGSENNCIQNGDLNRTLIVEDIIGVQIITEFCEITLLYNVPDEHTENIRYCMTGTDEWKIIS